MPKKTTKSIVEAAQKLKVQNKKLVERDKAKDRFFALTSHEIRTPLSSIIATAQYVHDGFADSEKEVKEYVDVILEEGKHLLNIINDILDYSKIQSGKIDMNIQQLDPVELLNTRVSHMKKLALAKGVKISLENIQTELCYFDSTRLAQVIDNILHNGIKFNKENGQLVIKNQISEKFMTITIADSGQGIAKSQQHRVFNEFETIENIRNHHVGTGLGMPISKKLIELMGGSISFRSVEGRGTTFQITIPRERISSQEHYNDQSIAFVKAAS